MFWLSWQILYLAPFYLFILIGSERFVLFKNYIKYESLEPQYLMGKPYSAVYNQQVDIDDNIKLNSPSKITKIKKGLFFIL